MKKNSKQNTIHWILWGQKSGLLSRPSTSRSVKDHPVNLPAKPRHPSLLSFPVTCAVTPPKRAPLTNPATSPAAPERCRTLSALSALAAPAPPPPPKACRALSPSLPPGPASLAGRAGGSASGRHSQVQEEPDFLAGAVPAHGGERGMRRGPRNTAGSGECGDAGPARRSVPRWRRRPGMTGVVVPLPARLGAP